MRRGKGWGDTGEDGKMQERTGICRRRQGNRRRDGGTGRRRGYAGEDGGTDGEMGERGDAGKDGEKWEGEGER